MNQTQLELPLSVPVHNLLSCVFHCYEQGMSVVDATVHCVEQGYKDITARAVRTMFAQIDASYP